MMLSVKNLVPLGRPGRVALASLGGSVLIIIAAIVALGLVGFRVNFTPSEPLGLWRIVPFDRAVRTGDLVFVCPPIVDAMREARRRGYLRRGLCAGGIAPLIKAIAATPGAVVEVDDEVRIDGQRLLGSRVMARDGEGRGMISYAGGVIPAGTVYLHSDFRGSFDSRYFGPVSIENVLGLAQEVWAYAP